MHCAFLEEKIRVIYFGKNRGPAERSPRTFPQASPRSQSGRLTRRDIAGSTDRFWPFGHSRRTSPPGLASYGIRRRRLPIQSCCQAMTDLICELGRRRLPPLPELYFGIVI